MSNVTNQPVSPFLGAFVLETLTIGMYGESRNAIREYIQNAFDSIRRAIHDKKMLSPDEGLITITLSVDESALTIRDNGVGLGVRNATSTLTRVGASGKNYKQDAGFRGIGRLAGIVFSNKITFVTKAKGEHEETTVVFDGRAMRQAMTPQRGSSQSAEDIIKTNVRAFTSPSEDVDGHFLEVRMQGFEEPPRECISALELRSFVSQVAPVPYSSAFPLGEELHKAAEETGIAIETVAISLKESSDGDFVPITKPYGAKYQLKGGEVELKNCEIKKSRMNGKRWWAWIGSNDLSGAYLDATVGGLRVRVRNIQIDGTEIVRNIFRSHAPSYVRFQDYFIGEIFIEPSLLVPNARRDGFEENASWADVRDELAKLVKELGSKAYKTSNKGMYSVGAQKKNRDKAKKAFAAMKRSGFLDRQKSIQLSTEITKYQQRLAKSSQDADLATLTELQAIGSELGDIKREVNENIGTDDAAVDREQVEVETREQLGKEVMNALEDELSPQCLSEVRTILTGRGLL